jgi:hypothetical protein
VDQRREAMMQDDDKDAEREAFVKETAAKAVAKYEGHLPAWLVKEMQAALEDVLATHPVGSALVDRVRPRKAPERSGETAKDGSVKEAPKEERRRKGAKR